MDSLAIFDPNEGGVLGGHFPEHLAQAIGRIQKLRAEMISTITEWTHLVNS